MRVRSFGALVLIEAGVVSGLFSFLSVLILILILILVLVLVLAPVPAHPKQSRTRMIEAPKQRLAFGAQPANFFMSMPAPVNPAPALSKRQIFLRRLASSVALWTIILAAMFSGKRFIADGVFMLIIAFLALAGLVEFYGLAQKRGLACFKVSGVIGGVLLMCGTFAHLHGWLGIFDSPARVNDFETDFLILFVLGLGVRQLCARLNPDGLSAISVTMFGLMYVPWLLNFIQKINFFPGVEGKYFLLYFILLTKFSDMGAYVVGSLIGRHKMIPRISPGKTWEGFGRGDCGFHRRERGVRAFSRPPHGRHEPHPRHRAGHHFEFHRRDWRFDRIAVQARVRRERFGARCCRASAASWTCSTACLFNAPIMYLYLRHVLVP